MRRRNNSDRIFHREGSSDALKVANQQPSEALFTRRTSKARGNACMLVDDVSSLAPGYGLSLEGHGVSCCLYWPT